MTIRDYIVNGVRVAVRVVAGFTVGVAGAAAATYAGDRFGVVIDVESLTGPAVFAAEVAVIGATSAVLLKLEDRFPWLTRVLSFGLKTPPPSYSRPIEATPPPMV